MTCSQLITKLENIQNSHRELNQTVNSFDDFKNSEASIKEKSQYLLDMYKARKRIRNELGEAWLFKTEEAEKLMGSENFFGPKEVSRALKIEVSPAEIPPVLFTEKELKDAVRLNHFLILRVDRAPDGQPLTMEKLIEIKNNKKANGDKFTPGRDWEKEEPYYKQKLLKTSWALVSREFIPDSEGKRYVGQIEVVIKYIQEVVFKDMEMPQEYQSAIDEFNNESQRIRKIMEDDRFNGWIKAGKELEKLKIVKLLRRNATEVLYDFAVVLDGKDNGKQLLAPKRDEEDNITEVYSEWTNSRGKDGRFIGVRIMDFGDKTTTITAKGRTIKDIIDFHGYRADTGPFGVCLSRQFAK